MRTQLVCLRPRKTCRKATQQGLHVNPHRPALGLLVTTAEESAPNENRAIGMGVGWFCQHLAFIFPLVQLHPPFRSSGTRQRALQITEPISPDLNLRWQSLQQTETSLRQTPVRHVGVMLPNPAIKQISIKQISTALYPRAPPAT